MDRNTTGVLLLTNDGAEGFYGWYDRIHKDYMKKPVKEQNRRNGPIYQTVCSGDGFPRHTLGKSSGIYESARRFSVCGMECGSGALKAPKNITMS